MILKLINLLIIILFPSPTFCKNKLNEFLEKYDFVFI